MSLDIPLGKAVINDIIPAIAKLRTNNRITFNSLFNDSLLSYCGVQPGFEASDLTKTDDFFDSLTFKWVFSISNFKPFC